MEDQEDEVFDVIIVGAGACGLAVAARLCEKTPSSLFTDSEHQRYHWIKKDHAKRTSKFQKWRKGTTPDRLCPGSRVVANSGKPSMIVFDAHSDQWMHDWNERFGALGIKYLRSPMFFHGDPRDRDALLAYAFLKDRLGDLDEIPNVVGKELSKHQRKLKSGRRNGSQPSPTYLDERDRKDYYRPPQDMFKEFCEEIVERYKLGNLVRKAEVQDIDYQQNEGIFTVRTSTGTRKARTVVLAMGSALERRLPADCPFSTSDQQEGSVIHVFGTKTTGELPAHVLEKIKAGRETNVVIVGGGLTSAQITDTIAKSGVTKVHHLMRRPMSIKQFDVDLSWAAKFRNRNMSAFWSADSDEERFEMICSARNGGSITPQYFKKLQAHIKSDKVAIHQSVVIKSGNWDPTTKTWSLELSSTPDPSIPSSSQPTRITLPKIDHIIYATGMPVNFSTIPCLSSLQAKYPVEVVGQLPCLNDHLMWNDKLPLFVAGRLAGLRCGPWAGNLDGVRQSAERIAWKIPEFLERRRGDEEDGVKETRDSGYVSLEEEEDEEVDLRRLGLGFGNSFAILGDE